ncbi:winged helix-turn-helix domain-containing protein [Streptosporangiaceae bacterium NEAU-GS5]|nr:winged helix-turn-helix domain-containing protein [Streptosporangiaceae bacterium NEAU-GS5]
MRITLLGPVEVADDAGAAVEVSGARLRSLLACLALAPGRLVTVEALVDAVWPDAPPSGAVNALQSLVSRLRRALPEADAVRLERLPAGYRLATPPEWVDACRFEQLAAAARSAPDQAAAARLLDEALGLWRGAPLADVEPAGFAVAAAARLTELRLRVLEDQADVRLALGESDGLAGDLAVLTAAHPLRERLWAARMRALCAAGRPAEALAAFDDLRRHLAGELGADPSPEVRALHLAILRGELTQAPAGGTNLRAPLTALVGREDDLTRVGALLTENRLVTLVGPGGAGKTRLASEVAATWRERDGAWLVELAAVGDPAQVPAAVAAALDPRAATVRVRHPLAREPIDRLVEALRDRRLLIVLDNCEHLVDACARLADAVVSRCPQVRVLATSREPLAVTGETIHVVGPLRVPSPDVPLERAARFPALLLFAQRAAAVRPGFALTPANLPAVAELCRRLDGLPLAIELACARLRTLPVEELTARLGDRFRLLTGGSRTAVPRHQSLLAVVEWSWDLLTPAERALARRLAVFAGGASLETVEAVCSDPDALPRETVLETLGGLVDKSLVVLVETSGARYRMLDTIQAYAARVLADSGEAEHVRQALAAYFLGMAESAEPALRTGDQLRWLAWLAQEHDNLVAVLRWAVDRPDAATAVRLTAALGWYWNLRGDHAEAAAWLDAALALPGIERAGEALASAYAYHAMHLFAIQETERGLASAAVARRLAGEGAPTDPAVALLEVLFRLHPANPDHDADEALAHLAELGRHPDAWLAATARLFRGLALAAFGDAAAAASELMTARDGFGVAGDRWGRAAAVSSLGSCHSLTGDHDAAIAAMSEALGLIHALGSDGDAQWARVELGLERLRAGDLAGARADLEHARTADQASGATMVAAAASVGLAETSRAHGDLGEARALLTGALRRLDAAEGVPPQIRARALVGLARVGVRDGQRAQARSRLDEALSLTLDVSHRSLIAEVAEGMADLALADDLPGDAAGLLGLAAAVRGAADLGSPDVRQAEAAARKALGDEAYAAAYAATAGLGTDAALHTIQTRRL